MAVRNRLEVTVLPQDFSKEQQEQARKNISAAAISATISKIESSDGTVSAEAYTAADGSIHYNLKVSAEPVISDTVIYGTNGISAKNQGVNWTIGLSADYLTANALDNLSGNWQNTYNTVTNNSGKWNEVSSKLDTTAFSTVSGQFAIKTEVQEEFEQTSAWAVETFQPKGDYLSASEKYLSANALDDLSGNWNSVYDTVESYSSKWNDASATLFNNSGKWNSVYNTVDTNSANWGKGYNWIFDNSANIINASATLETNSGKWENSYTALTSTSATWNDVSAKLDKSAFEEWSANADVTEYSGVSPIGISEHKVSIDLSEYYKKTETSGKEELNARFEPIEADLDILKENSAHNVVESKNDYIKVYSGTNKFELEFTSGDLLATKTWVEQVLSDFGGFVPADPTGDDNHPNVTNPSNKKIYLVADATAPEPDKSREWIVTGENPNTGWYCIGDTSLDLTPYVKISDISAASATWNNAYNWVYNNSANVVEASGAIKEVSSTFTAYSGKWNDASATLFNNSSKWENSYTALTSKSADWNEVSAKLDASESAKYMFLSDLKGTEDGKLSGYGSSAFYYPEIPEYSGKDGIKVEDYWITISADYLTANALDELSGNWEQSYTALTATSANWNSVYTSVNENSASWNETSAVVNNNSAKWNEASAFSANSGKFVTSALNDFTAGLAHVLTKDEQDNVAWSGIDLSDLGKMYPITSLTPDIVSATISAVDGTSAYVLSAASAAEIPGISGVSGVSAYFDSDKNKYIVGLEEQTYCYAEAQSEQTTITSTSEILGHFENINIIGDSIDITSDPEEITLAKGLYHIDIQVNVNITSAAPAYYDVELVNSLSNGALSKVIDGSYIHTETLDLSFDVKLVNTANTLTFTLKNMPTGSTYFIKNLQIHEIVTIDGMLDVAGGLYNGGEAISIDSQNNINVKYDALSGIGVTPNNELYVKLGKGLSFTNDGGVNGVLALDEVTEEVVETVQSLQRELDNKLSTNMNISDAKNIGSMFKNAAVASLGCSLFTVPLQHNLTTATEISFFTTQGLNQDASFPMIFGILEYNFDYFDPETHQYRSQTKWIGDTGPIYKDTQDVKGHAIGGGANKYTFKLKHLTDVISADIPYNDKIYHNEVGPVLRSDRAYYLAVFAKHPDGLGYVLGDAGYGAVTNSDPYISWYSDNCQYVEGSNSATMDNNWDGWDQDLTLEKISYWVRGGEANDIVRPLVMIRNVNE